MSMRAFAPVVARSLNPSLSLTTSSLEKDCSASQAFYNPYSGVPVGIEPHKSTTFLRGYLRSLHFTEAFCMINILCTKASKPQIGSHQQSHTRYDLTEDWSHQSSTVVPVPVVKNAAHT
jgi:hypothetical protein